VDADRARALAERLHHGQRDAGGAPLIDHVRRVAAAVPRDARVVAWLHEALEYTSISEEALLTEGLSLDELRALRLLTHDKDARSNTTYLAHVELIARAKGASAGVARTVKRADLADRALNLRSEPTDGHRPTSSGSRSCATRSLPTLASHRRPRNPGAHDPCRRRR
jgi:(p)ppGpp synthase/HD superfamily hydrolase